MRFCGQEWSDPYKTRDAWAWAVLGTILIHGLLVIGMVVFFQDRPVRTRVVVPVEAVTLVPFRPGAPGGGGQPAPVAQPQPPPPKPAAPPVRPKPKVKPAPPPKVKPIAPPLPEPTKAPTIPTPAPTPDLTRAKPSVNATASRAAAPGGATSASGTGQGGSGRGQGTGSGSGVGPAQGRGPGGGSILQGYLREIRRILEKQKDYPMMARRRNIQGVVVVLFTIASSGQVESARVSRSSGHDLLDEGARNTIKRVGRFPPFPADLNRPKLTIEIPLAFRLTTR